MLNPYPLGGSRPLEQLKVAELRDELRKRGLSLKGVKKDLLERLEEAVQKEQAGTPPSQPEVAEGQDKDVHGIHELEGEHGITHSAGHPHDYNTLENVQDDDGLLYLNDSESRLQDSALIVNNASPYVGASDTTPVFMEPHKEAERLDPGFVMSAESKDDVSRISNANSVSALPEPINADGGDASRPDNLVLESNATCPGYDDQAVKNAAFVSEPDMQSSGNKAVLIEKEVNDVDLAGDNHQVGENDVVPESVSEAGGNDGLSFARELNNSMVSNDETSSVPNCAPNGDNGIVGETVTLVQKPEVAEMMSQGEMVIPSEAVKDASNASVSVDVLRAANGSLLTSNCEKIADGSAAQDAKLTEEAALTSVNVVSSVLETFEDGGFKVESVEDVSLNADGAEDTKKVEVLEGGETSILTPADGEASEMPLGAVIAEAVQDPILPEVQQDISIPELVQDSVMHEALLDVVVQDMPQDTEMLEALESPPMKMEVSEMASDTKLPVIGLDALNHFIGTKSEDLGSHPADSNQLNAIIGGMVVDEEKPNVKFEPMQSESRGGRRTVPVEDVKLELQDAKEDLHKSRSSFDRSRQWESEHERSRHELGRASAYGNERKRPERRPGRVFREERRKDPKERELKPFEGEFPEHGSHKRKDDDRHTKQQEPAKRVRRWNSGNESVVETAKPSTTGSVREMMPPEIEKEGFAVAPPKLTPKSSGPSKPIPAAAKTNLEANGDKRAVPPSARVPTSSLKVERFVRPFTLKAVKDLLAAHGQCVEFWMDQIKTHCYVMYSNVDEAIAARNGLYNKQWPPSFGNLLVADFVDPDEVKIRLDGSYEKMNSPPATTPQGLSNLPSAPGTYPSGSFHGHSNALAFAPPLRERQLMRVSTKEPEAPVPTLDDLFRKTKAKPHIYYLPLTDEQVAEKLASAKNKEEQQARIKPSARV